MEKVSDLASDIPLKKFVVKVQIYMTVESESLESCQEMLDDLNVTLRHCDEELGIPLIAYVNVEREERAH